MDNTAKDLVVLGAGPGGYVAAIRAAQLGRKVTIIEREALGGVCLNWGCIPSKALLRSAQIFHDIKRAESFGISCSAPKADLPAIIKRSRDVAAKLSGGVEYLMKKNKVEVLKGSAALDGRNSLSLKTPDGKSQTLNYRDIIIATGARPRPLPGIDVDGQYIHTSRTILENKKLPAKMLVIGAGAIGMEFAWFYSTLGTEVTVAEMLPQILPLEDEEISNALRRVLEKGGMKIRTGAGVSDLKVHNASVTASIKGPDGEEKWQGDACLVAIGVMPNSENIGLEKAGITLEKGFIKVDQFMRTSTPHHFAIGDVTGKQLLAHKASHEGLVAAEAACGRTQHGMRYDNIPGCTYCQPQVASVGLTEKAAKEKGLKYKVAKIPFSAIGKAIAIGDEAGLVKTITEATTGEVLGVHIMHAEATEIISEAAVIRSHEGIAESVLDTVHPHPTLSESIMEAMALSLGRPINT